MNGDEDPYLSGSSSSGGVIQKNTQTTHKQHGLQMERECTKVIRTSKQSGLLQYTRQPPCMFMKETTHILVEEEKGLKHKKKHPEMGKKV